MGDHIMTRPTAAQVGILLKTAIALQTLTLFIQSVTAGMLLTSSHGYLMHDIGSKVMYAAAMLYVLAAFLAWRPGGGSPRPVLCATGFLLLASAQVALGVAHVPSLHVPLGVVMFALSTLALARALAPRSLPRPAVGP
jgi:heme A synthase